MALLSPATDSMIRKSLPFLLYGFFIAQTIYWSLDVVYPKTLFKYVMIHLALFMILQIGFWVTDYHRRWGFFKVSEPPSHFWFAMRNFWIVPTWALGMYWYAAILGIGPDPTYKYDPDNHFSHMPWDIVPKEYKLEVESTAARVFWTVIIFYISDFTRYWAHRLGHMQFFYRTFPMSHAVHHNQVFVHPLLIGSSPFWHFTNFATVTPMVFFWAIGLRHSAVWAALLQIPCNISQHLGSDPFPWVSKASHRYFYGALPWVAVYHQYHHIPWVPRGNFGNTTALWDYVHGTIIPESIEHIETGKVPKHVQDRFNSLKLNEEFEGKLKNRNVLDYNRQWDSSIFNFRYL
jgi:sterol desaturase/sphingolipid hydroxylase (fatty acid hydroxylase superfamily)